VIVTRCGKCCREYTREQLERLGNIGQAWMAGELLRYFNCPCGSTMTIVVGRTADAPEMQPVVEASL
jgi:hypothetical protein